MPDSSTASPDEASITLSDTGVTVDGAEVSQTAGSAVYLSHDIIYYEDRDTYDSGNPYGEGTAGGLMVSRARCPAALSLIPTVKGLPAAGSPPRSST